MASLLRTTLVSVVVVDDHPMVRDVVKFACMDAADVSVVGEAGDGPAAMRICADLQPTVLVLDLALPGADGFEVIRRVRDASPQTHVLVLSGRDDEEAVFESMRRGAAGFVPKTAALEDILHAIRAVGSGGRAFAPSVERRARSRIGAMARGARRTARVQARLTPRERQVLACIASGLTSRQIASRLGISERTVETYVGGLFDKLGARTRAQVVREAVRLGLVDVA